MTYDSKTVRKAIDKALLILKATQAYDSQANRTQNLRVVMPIEYGVNRIWDIDLIALLGIPASTSARALIDDKKAYAKIEAHMNTHEGAIRNHLEDEERGEGDDNE